MPRSDFGTQREKVEKAIERQLHDYQTNLEKKVEEQKIGDSKFTFVTGCDKGRITGKSGILSFVIGRSPAGCSFP